MIKSLLKRKNISIYSLAKETGISYSTLNYIVNDKTEIDKCNLETFRKIAKALKMSMDELYEECQYTLDEFEVFKSNTCHYLKKIGPFDFIEQLLTSNEVEDRWEENKLQSLYLIAMVDYLSRLNNLPLCNKYNKYRTYRLEKPIYPTSYYAHKKVVPAYELKNIIPEFENFGIMEGDVFDVR